MKHRLLCILLILCLLLPVTPMLGATASTDYFYGVVERAYDSEGFLSLSIETPGVDHFTMGGEHQRISPNANIYINMEPCTSLTEVESFLSKNSPATVSYTLDREEIDGRWGEYITNLWIGTNILNSGSSRYDTATQTFTNINYDPNLPILYWDDDEGYCRPAYLDDQHTYQLHVYSGAVLIRSMRPIKDDDFPINRVGMKNNPNKDLLADLAFRIYAEEALAYDDPVLHATLCEEDGTPLATQTAAINYDSATVTFTNMPDENANRIIKAWITDSSGDSVTPTYEYNYRQEVFDGGEGILTDVISEGAYAVIATVDTGDEWGEEELYFASSGIVDGKLYTDLASLKAALKAKIGTRIRFVRSETMTAVAGTASWNSHGYLLQYDYSKDNTAIIARMALPSGEVKEFTITTAADIDGATYETVQSLHLALLDVLYSYTSFNQTDGVITSLVSAPKTCTGTYSDLTLNWDGTLEGLPAAATGLPVYYKQAGESFALPYLDEHHIYDANYYEGFAIEITQMKANENYSATITRVDTDYRPNKDFLLDLDLFCTLDYFDDCMVVARLEDSNHNYITDGYVNISDGYAELTLTDIPNETADYIVGICVSDGNLISPSYDIPIHIDALKTGHARIENPAYNYDTGYFHLEFLDTSDPTSPSGFSTDCAVPVYINGFAYTDVGEMTELLPDMKYVDYILDRNGNLGAVQYDDGLEYLYGKLTGYSYHADEFDNYGLFIQVMTPELKTEEYRVTTKTWINGHCYDEDNLTDPIYSDMYNNYVTFALNEQGSLATLKSSEEESEFFYNLTYNEETGTFLDGSTLKALPKLPVYYCPAPDYEHLTPTLDSNHTYQADVYDYAIEIKAIKAINMDATVTSLKASVELNQSFTYDATVSCPVSIAGEDKTYTLRVQLLDEKGRLLKDFSAEHANRAVFQNLPSQYAKYTAKVWVLRDGAAVSPVYTTTFGTGRADVRYGTIIASMEESNEWDNSSRLALKLELPNDPNSVYLYCDENTCINGKAGLSPAEQQEILTDGSMIQFAYKTDTATVVKTLSTMHALTGTSKVTNQEDSSTTDVSVNIYLKRAEDNPVTGTLYVGIYNQLGILKKIASVPKTLATSLSETITVPGVTLTKGDYVKVLYWTADNAAISNAAELDIE